MKKISQLISVIMLFTIVGIYACSKTETPAPVIPPAPVNNSFLTIDTAKSAMTVTCASVTGKYAIKGISNDSTITCELDFQNQPMADGTFFAGATLDAGNYLFSFTKNGTVYTASVGGSLTVTINNGKITAAFTALRTKNGLVIKNIDGKLECK